MSSDRSTPAPRWPDAQWVTHATGHRVTVRTRAGGLGPSGGPALSDVVGVLEHTTPDEWTVRTRTGDRVTVDPTDVVAAVVVPDIPARLRTASDIEDGALEVVAADGWQPLEREQLGGWTLRASRGFTGRANSVLPLGEPETDIDSALEAVRAWYAERSLTPMFQMPVPLRDDLDAALTERGWDHYNQTHVMVCDVAPLLMTTESATSEDVRCVTTRRPDSRWLDAFRYRGLPLPEELAPILTMNDHAVFVSALGTDDEVRAVARGAITGQWLGITALEVREPFRRQGLGHQVLSALAQYASTHGVRHVYLQVAHDNASAIALYRRLGFTGHHDYRYRRWQAG